MSVLIETSVGDLVVDLFVDKSPLTCNNFLKLCKLKHYNNNIFWNVQKDFVAQTGDPSGSGDAGVSAWYKLKEVDQGNPLCSNEKYIKDEVNNGLKHDKIGLLCMNNTESNKNGSSFYFTQKSGISYLDGKHTIFGEIAEEEGLLVLARINETFCDAKHAPYQNIRILHTVVQDDPFEEVMSTYPESPVMSKDKFDEGRLRADDCWVDEFSLMTAGEIQKSLRQKEVERRAAVLTLLGDQPSIYAAPPENVAFVCKQNPVTEESDQSTIFRSCGSVKSCAIIKDKVTKTSLGYGFVEYDTAKQCEEAVKRLNNAVIDDRRIRVDFSQSVAHLLKESKMGERKLGDKPATSTNRITGGAFQDNINLALRDTKDRDYRRN